MENFKIGKTYKISIKDESDYVDAIFLECKIYDYPDYLDYNSEDTEQSYDDEDSYSLKIFREKANISFDILNNTKLFVFERLPPFDPWYFGGESNTKDSTKQLFDNYNYYHSTRRLRCSRLNIVDIPINALEYLEFNELI